MSGADATGKDLHGGICGYNPHVLTFRIRKPQTCSGSAMTRCDGGPSPGGSRRPQIGQDDWRSRVVLARYAQELADAADHGDDLPIVAQSVRNRFTGLVTRVVRDTVMAQVDIQAGPHRFVSLLSREAADELGLEPGLLAVAAVKATNVSIEIPRTR